VYRTEIVLFAFLILHRMPIRNFVVTREHLTSHIAYRRSIAAVLLIQLAHNIRIL